MILIAILALISVLAPQTPDPMHAVVRPALMSVRCNDTGWEAQIRLTTNLEDSTWNVRQPVKSQWAPRRTQPSDRTFTTTVRSDDPSFTITGSVLLMSSDATRIGYFGKTVKRPAACA